MSETRAYAFKPRITFPIDAQTAGEALERVKGHNSGDLTPEAVVEAAKDKRNPLHAVFEWDDSKAAHEYRLQQAGVLIRSVVVTVSRALPASEAVDVRVTDTSRSGGASTAKVVSAEELHRAKVDRGWRELEDWHKQYGVLPEFVGVAAALSGFLTMRAQAQSGKPKKKAAA